MAALPQVAQQASSLLPRTPAATNPATARHLAAAYGDQVRCGPPVVPLQVLFTLAVDFVHSSLCMEQRTQLAAVELEGVQASHVPEKSCMVPSLTSVGSAVGIITSATHTAPCFALFPLVECCKQMLSLCVRRWHHL
jgi:hypothetical protein